MERLLLIVTMDLKLKVLIVAVDHNHLLTKVDRVITNQVAMMMTALRMLMTVLKRMIVLMKMIPINMKM